MCGIHGIVSLSRCHQFKKEQLDIMGDATIHRGPDDSGEFIGEGIAIGMRRLSIIDLSGGHQPISCQDNRFWIVCNGEIYNYRELRTELKEKGYSFKTNSDVEVIIHLYREYGLECLQYLNGMFAFALWDDERKRLLLARDRLGIKPLYYSVTEEQLVFASEAKAILSLRNLKAEIEPKALNQYFELGYVPAPLSIFKGIRKLEVASYLSVDNGNIRQNRYWEPDYNQEQLSNEEWAHRIFKQLEKSVVRQMVSDVPIGSFLSGGIDSSAVVGIMAKHSCEPVSTYAIGFKGSKAERFYNELPYAKKVAEMFGTRHKEILVNPDIIGLLPHLIWHMDEPIADSAFITTYLVSEFACKDSTVILSGVGGDELFAGYRRYQGEYFSEKYKLIPEFIRKGLIMPCAKKLPASRNSKWLNYMRMGKAFVQTAEKNLVERYYSYIEVFSESMRDQLLKGRVSDGVIKNLFKETRAEDALWQMFDIDRQSQLPDDLLMLTDKMTMATSLECRVPFLDHEMVELAVSIPEQQLLKKGELKYLLKKALKGFLPDSILYRPKRGFGAPMGAWLQKELFSLMTNLLNKKSVEKRDVLNWAVIEHTIHQHQTNKEDCTDHLLALLNFEIWCKLYLDEMSIEETTKQIRDAIA